MTEAQEFIRARRGKAPGEDSVVTLWKIVEPELPEWAKAMLASGKLAIGKLDEAQPRAITEVEDDGSIAVGISAGYFDFIYAFARPIAGQQTVTGRGTTVQASLSRAQVIDEFKRLSTLFTGGAHVLRSQIPIHPSQLNIANETATYAELLVLGHELGHVAVETNHAPPGSSPETEADLFAARLLLAAGARINYRMLLAGAIFGLRIYALLERLGCTFRHSHPPPAERLAVIAQAATAHFGSRALMMAKLSITVAFDEFVESLENEAQGKGIDTVQTPLRVGTRLRAMLEEAAGGRLSFATLPGELRDGFKGVPHAMLLNEVDAYTQDVLAGAVPSGAEGIGMLTAAIPSLVPSLKKSFLEGLRKGGIQLNY